MSAVTYISIGNSDDKLTQLEWSQFYREVDIAIRFSSKLMGSPRVHGQWVSAPTDPWQNACWCVDLTPGLAARLRRVLAVFADEYKQDSIAWADAPETDFIEPSRLGSA